MTFEHTAFVGKVGSGKTFLAQEFAKKLKQKGMRILAYNPLLDPNWNKIANVSTDDPEKFLTIAETNNNCLIVTEEIGMLEEQSQKDRVKRLFTIGRHFGRLNFIIAQRGEQIPPIIRDNCLRLCLFRTSKAGADFWFQQFDDRRIYNAVSFPPRVFLDFRAGQDVHRRILSTE